MFVTGHRYNIGLKLSRTKSRMNYIHIILVFLLARNEDLWYFRTLFLCNTSIYITFILINLPLPRPPINIRLCVCILYYLLEP